MNKEDLVGHEIVNGECTGCWREKPYNCDCGGHIHSQFGDYTSEDSYYLEFFCDKCESTEMPEEAY